MSGDLHAGEYRFGEFAFDSVDNTLRRRGSIVPVKPKALELLRVFLANQGRLLSKADLMNELWADSFVEESNLAVTIRQLRMALADDAHNPVFIETVARRGYRFVAEVERARIPGSEPPPSRSERRVGYLIPLAVAAGLLIASISLGSLYLRSGNSQAAPILSAPFAAQKLSTSGKVYSAVISPDGTKVVYTVRTGSGESVWLREAFSENNIEIFPASNQDYYNFAVSPDGETLYFTRGSRTIDDPADLFRVPIFGGIPKKLVSDTRGWISISPDGKTVSFVRCGFSEKQYCSLWTANSLDGGGQRMIASRPGPLWIGDHEIAPDGKSIVFASGQSQNGGSGYGLTSVDLDSGTEREITTERFFNIKSIEILPDNSGVLLTGSRQATRHYRVWKLDYADGSVHALSKDSESYSDISMDDSGSLLIATKVEHDFRLLQTDMNDTTQKETVAEQVARFAFNSSGGIVYQSESTGDLEIWTANADGSSQRQLTNQPGDDGSPVFSPDNSEIYFCSNRSGEMQVWRMDADGSNQRQATISNGGIPVFANKEWIYYQHGIDRTLWRVTPDGNFQESVAKISPYRGPFVFSPSGTRMAFITLREGIPAFVVLSIPDGRELTSHPMAEGKGRFEIAWLPDESGLVYSLADLEGEANTLWIQSIEGGEPRRTANLGDEEIGALSFSPATGALAFTQGSWKHDLVMLTGVQ